METRPYFGKFCLPRDKRFLIQYKYYLVPQTYLALNTIYLFISFSGKFFKLDLVLNFRFSLWVHEVIFSQICWFQTHHFNISLLSSCLAFVISQEKKGNDQDLIRSNSTFHR